VQKVSVKVGVCVCLRSEQHTIHFSSISIEVCCKASWGKCKEMNDTLQDMNSTKNAEEKPQEESLGSVRMHLHPEDPSGQFIPVGFS